MPEKRHIAVYTGNRAEYGLQSPVLKALRNSPRLKVTLVVSGAHLDENFGLTKDEIIRDGFPDFVEAPIILNGDSLLDTTLAISSAIQSVASVLLELKPDLCLIYADRFEAFAAMIASTQMNIPTAHLEGGDLTEGGALDDSVRHAMTKLAHFHFTTNKQAAQRVLGLGEEPWRVHNVGFPVIDLIHEGDFASPNDLAKQFALDFKLPIVIFTQHSITTEVESVVSQIAGPLEALKLLAENGTQVIATYPNNDAGGRTIIKYMKESGFASLENVQVHKSLGRSNYHGLLNVCVNHASGICVGNSSSGIKETPAFGCPTVNIGARQSGRLRADNVLDVGYGEVEVLEACKKALFDNKFRARCRKAFNPYGLGNAGKKIATVLSETPLGPSVTQKKMTI